MGFRSCPEVPTCDLVSSGDLPSSYLLPGLGLPALHSPPLDAAPAAAGPRAPGLLRQLSLTWDPGWQRGSLRGQGWLVVGQPVPSKLRALSPGLRHCVEGSGPEDW